MHGYITFVIHIEERMKTENKTNLIYKINQKVVQNGNSFYLTLEIPKSSINSFTNQIIIIVKASIAKSRNRVSGIQLTIIYFFKLSFRIFVLILS